jgi:nucleotidyltransferase/DNA polymerase involved in DNA repair
VRAIACLAIPRFELVAACRADGALLSRPIVTVARGTGGSAVQEVSATGEREGVERGMRLARALALCPALRIATADPVGAEELWERVVTALEGIGAEVESNRAGEAFFEVNPLRGIHGGSPEDVVAAARRAVPLPVRGGVSPARFASFVAAATAKSQSQRIVPAEKVGDFLSPLTVSWLATGPGLPERAAHRLILALEDLGIETLGSLAALSAAHLADRFGELGIAARQLVHAEDADLRPRTTREEIADEIEVDGVAGVQLERALELLVERVLAAPQRRGRPALAMRLVVRLVEGGSWSVDQVLGSPTERAGTLSALLLRRLEELPGPPGSLALRLTALGPRGGDQLELRTQSGPSSDDRLAEAIRQVRALDGAEALLDIVDVDPASRVPERRALLAPYSHGRRRRER